MGLYAVAVLTISQDGTVTDVNGSPKTTSTGFVDAIMRWKFDARKSGTHLISPVFIADDGRRVVCEFTPRDS